MIFRREPLHKKLAREAELDQAETASPADVGPHWGATGIHGVPRPRRWDAVASAEAAGLSGDELHFVAGEAGRLGGRNRVPAARSRDAVDADSAPVRPRIDGGRLSLGEVVEAGLARELLVDRLAPEDHCGSISP